MAIQKQMETLSEGSFFLEAYAEWVEQNSFYFDADRGSMREGLYLTAGLVSEVGEFCELMRHFSQKWFNLRIFVDEPDMRDKASEELGDIFWYLTRFAVVFNIPLEVILRQNVDKLNKRHNLLGKEKEGGKE